MTFVSNILKVPEDPLSGNTFFRQNPKWPLGGQAGRGVKYLLLPYVMFSVVLGVFQVPESISDVIFDISFMQVLKIQYGRQTP